MLGKEEIDKLEKARKELHKGKYRFKDKWKELSKYLGLSYGNWEEDTRPNDERMADVTTVYDNTASESSNLEADGIAGYACGSSLAWFGLSLEKERSGKSENTDVLQTWSNHIYKVFQNSNFYVASRSMTQCNCNFGTSIMWMEDDPMRGIPYYKVLHLKDCDIGENNFGEVDSLFRTFWMTVGEIKDKYPDVDLKDRDDFEYHKIYCWCGPRSKYDNIGKKVNGNKNWVAVYWMDDNKRETIREDEYDRKPFTVWRYNHSAFDGVWGVDSPGLTQLSNIKELNSIGESIVRLTQLTGLPPGKKTRGLKINFTPGGFTEVGAGEDYAMVNVTGNLQWVDAHKQDLQKKVRNAYYADYFLVLTENIDRAKTATEVQGLQNEKSAIMAAFFSRMAHEFLEPVLEWTIQNEVYNGRLPELDKWNALNGSELSIDFVSPLAKMQERASRLEPSISFVSMVGNLSQLYPIASMKLDVCKFLDSYAECYGVDTSIVKNTEEVNKQWQAVQQQQAQQLQAQQQMEAMKTAAKTQKDIATANKMNNGG